MKNLNVLSTLPTRRWWTILLALFFAMSISAQTISVKGVVKDAKSGETIVGANVIVKGTTTGTVTDVDGNFSLNAPSNATLVVKYVGYQDAELPVAGKSTLVIHLQESSIALSEVVAIGYGQVKKNDLTGSVVAVSADKLPKGLTTSMTDMLGGKIAGVNVSTSGGQPGGSATIRIRGGSSLNASNDPLIVVDNVPLASETINGVSNPLASINPQDIETFTVLKDASATAIYGSRASNGVILITTKKGSLKQKFNISYDGNVSVSTIAKTINVLSGDEYRAYMKSAWADSPSTLSAVNALLGKYSTNWQDQIYQTAIGHDHNLSISGAAGIIPYRISIGYTNQDGILKTSNYSRTTASINLTPSLLNDHLKINANAKGSYTTNRFADTGAIGSALEFDPTQPVYSLNGTAKTADGKSYGNGYYMWMGPSSPLSLGTANPLSVLNDTKDVSYVYQSTGGIQFDYKLHWLPELRANLNLAYDASLSNGSKSIVYNTPRAYVWGNDKSGSAQYSPYFQKKLNTVLDFYLNYNKTLGIQNIDAMAGYSWQRFYKDSWTSTTYATNSKNNVGRVDYPAEYYLVSFYGRLNYSLLSKYLLTFTVRDDGTSRFSPNNRWGVFPSAAFAWKLKEESFLKNVNWLSDLKLRLGYGLTGQQNVSDDYYPYLATYTTSAYTDAMYQFGNSFYHLLRPDKYNSTLKWETTTTYNVGLDFGLLNNRFTGSVDVYKRTTNDLLNTVSIAAGTNFTNKLLSNIGSMENKGIEVTLSGRVVQSKDFNWDLSYNVSHNENKVTKLNRGSNSAGVTSVNISGGTGNTICITQVGYPVNSYYVYKQLYDAKGNPIEGAYGNGGQLYISSHSAAPDVTMGLSSRMTYKNWYLNFAMRASIGNYNYNNVQSRLEFRSNTYDSSGFLKNTIPSSATTNFTSAQYLSDYYIQNASFLKMDNISLGYTFDKLFRGVKSATVYGTVQNPFMITKYKGLDPEAYNGTDAGIDNNVYPRPRVYMLGLRVNF
jgi:TonB-linked outer membrane protein, SusC/RagA family